jgi:hypothetical protein
VTAIDALIVAFVVRNGWEIYTKIKILIDMKNFETKKICGKIKNGSLTIDVADARMILNTTGLESSAANLNVMCTRHGSKKWRCLKIKDYLFKIKNGYNPLNDIDVSNCL